jgi:hypothetical protein
MKKTYDQLAFEQFKKDFLKSCNAPVLVKEPKSNYSSPKKNNK